MHDCVERNFVILLFSDASNAEIWFCDKIWKWEDNRLDNSLQKYSISVNVACSENSIFMFPARTENVWCTVHLHVHVTSYHLPKTGERYKNKMIHLFLSFCRRLWRRMPAVCPKKAGRCQNGSQIDEVTMQIKGIVSKGEK